MQDALPRDVQAALHHPLDYAVCALTPGCDPAPEPMIMGMMMAPTVLPPPAGGGGDPALAEPCDLPPETAETAEIEF